MLAVIISGTKYVIAVLELKQQYSLSLLLWASIAEKAVQLRGSSIFLITFSRHLPFSESMTIQRVKGLLYRLLRIPGSELKLSYKSSKVS